MKVKFILSGIMLAGALQVAAQTQQPRDKAYVEENTISSQPIPYPYMREADVMWEKRVWQEIDVREKMNEVLMHPSSNLFTVLMNAVKAGELTAYDTNPVRSEEHTSELQSLLRI